ncbi:peptidoglycan -binding protein [Azospirillum halopraeferens]|uniref:peptidoglycan -binding protein n=1 Tax=Azospirillum halopraeferens TaxID=34010 RepID=UPI0003FE7669|nr:peptidoglycan -binding protein [Azospirillum halopraeferens]
MASLSRRSGYREVNAWPGWVDALSSLIMVVMFLLMVFVVTQFYLANVITGRDEQLVRLNTRIAELNDLLALERDANADLRLNITQLSDELQASITAREDMSSQMLMLQDERDRLERAATELERTVRADRETIELKLREVASLEADLRALREARQRLEGEIAEMGTALRLTREERERLLAELGTVRDRAQALESTLADANQRTMLAQRTIEQRDIRIEELLAALDTAAGALDEEKALVSRTEEQIAVLNREMMALRAELARLNAALEASEALAEEQRVQIVDLGSRLNQALASKVQELARYRSEFFGRVREALGNRPDVRIVGDRFVFQSELLFPSGSATLQESGRQRLAELAQTLIEIGRNIPPEINWVLRVDGHTDIRPIATYQFPSNWELSAARAISVVKFLMEQGIPADRLVAAGFGEHQPLDPATGEDAMARNRRIEIKLDQR